MTSSSVGCYANELAKAALDLDVTCGNKLHLIQPNLGEWPGA